MNIELNSAVTVRITMTDLGARPPASNTDVLAYLHGHGNLFPKLEAALTGQRTGFKTSLQLSPDDTYGLRDPSLETTIPKSDFPPGIKVGSQIEMRGDDGENHHYYVVKVKGNKVLLDGNHPLAGKTLKLVVTVIAVRAATAEEIAHGHVHGEHGHQHG